MPKPRRSGGFIYCQNCGGGVRPRDSSCGWCGNAMPKSQRSGGGFKWVVIGCVGLIGLFAIIVIIAAISSESSSIGNAARRSVVRAAAASPTPAPTPTMVPPFLELADSARRITYEDLFRYNERYIGESVYYQGRVNQVIEMGNDIYALRVFVASESMATNIIRIFAYGGELADDVFMVYERGDGVRVLENDIIEFAGIVTGLHQYETVLGAQRTVPELLAIRIEPMYRP